MAFLRQHLRRARLGAPHRHPLAEPPRQGASHLLRAGRSPAPERTGPRTGVGHAPQDGVWLDRAPIGVGADRFIYNINTDLGAGEMAVTLGADKLMFLTNTSGVLDRDGKLLSMLEASAIETLMRDGVIDGGMIPKIGCALDAVKRGVNTAII
ncbi:Acetylglutamate kinase [Candidatus Entotheonellaceae bacterium PAL068K]